MSCTCNVCYCTLRAPLALWYVVTRHMWQTCYLCSQCLARIPQEARTPVREQQDFEPTFGPIMSEVSNRSGNYQSNGSEMLPPQFSVPFDVLERIFPGDSTLICDLEYYACPDHLMNLLLKAHREDTWAEWPTAAWPLERLLTVKGPLLESYLGLSPPAQSKRPVVLPYECREVTAQQSALADELWQAILAWDAARRPAWPGGVD
jgi:hypothetical protein